MWQRNVIYVLNTKSCLEQIQCFIFSGGKPEENLLQSAFRQTLGDKFTFQQETQGQIYTGVAYQDHIECSQVAELQFDLCLLENLWQDLALFEQQPT
jgi:hypothetical protein